MNLRRTSRRGFSLVELLAVVLVLAAVVAGSAEGEDVMVPGLDTAGQASKAQLPDSGKAKIGVRCRLGPETISRG